MESLNLNINDIETSDWRYGLISYLKTDQIIGRSLHEYGEWAQIELDFLLDLLDPGATVIDIGAFIGTHTLSFAQKVGNSGRVLAFEPNPSSFELLNLNVKQNSLSNITIYNVALSDITGTYFIAESDLIKRDNPGNLSLCDRLSKNPEEGNNSGLNLTILDNYSLDKCDLIKIDVEGMELNVLKGATKIIERFNPLIFAECLSIHDGWQIISLMKDKGYEAFLYNELAYNPNNFKNNPNNFFDAARECNLILVPHNKLQFFQSRCKYLEKVIPVRRIDDLALGLLKKPQYKPEVLARTEAAKILGFEFVANEPEIKEFKARIAAAESQAGELNSSLNTRDIQIKNQDNRINELTLQSQNKDARINELTLNSQNKDARINELTLNSQNKDAQIINMEVKLEENKNTNNALNVALKTANTVINNLQTKSHNQSALISELNTSIQDKNIQINYLQFQLEQIQHGILMRLRNKYQKIVEKLLSQGTRRRRMYQLVLKGIRVFLNEGGKIFLRKVKSYLYSKIKKNKKVKNKKSNTVDISPIPRINTINQDINNPPELVWNIDHFQLNGKRLYGWGWLFDKQQPVKELIFNVMVNNKCFHYPCQYGINRPDVAGCFNLEKTLNVGFIVSCFLPSTRISRCWLQVNYVNGSSSIAEVDQKVLANLSVSHGFRSSIIRWNRKSWELLSRGKFKTLFMKINQKIRIAWGGHKLKRRNFSQFAGVKKGPANISIIIDHNMGGGANLYRDEYISAKQKSSDRVFLLYYDLPTLNYRVRVYERDWKDEFIVESLDDFFNTVVHLNPEEIFLNDTVSFDTPLYLVSLLPVLKRKIHTKIIVAIHDYFPICPSYNLLDDSGQFCGIPNIERCHKCLPNNNGDFSLLVSEKEIGMWRHVWGSCLNSADSILCFSEASKRLLSQAYPALDLIKVQVRPHSVNYMSARKIQLNYSDGLNIGIIGKISRNKGSEIIHQMADIIIQRNLPVKITVVGELDGVDIPSVIKITGPYVRDKLPDMIESCGANVFFFPSIWPETFSYVTEELIKLEMPLAVFDLGAPAERVAKYKKGIIIKEINAENALTQIGIFYTNLIKA